MDRTGCRESRGKETRRELASLSIASNQKPCINGQLSSQSSSLLHLFYLGLTLGLVKYKIAHFIRRAYTEFDIIQTIILGWSNEINPAI